MSDKIKLNINSKVFHRLALKFNIEYRQFMDTIPDEPKSVKELEDIYYAMYKFWYDRMPIEKDPRRYKPCTASRYVICHMAIKEIKQDFEKDKKLIEEDLDARK